MRRDGREQWLNLHEVVERGALSIVERDAAHGGAALVRGQVAELAEATRNGLTLIRRQRAKLLHGATHLTTLLRIEPLHILDVCLRISTLLRIHRVQLRETLAIALLGLRRKLAEAGLVGQGPLLLLGCQVFVSFHPLAEVLAAARSLSTVAAGAHALALGGTAILLRWRSLHTRLRPLTLRPIIASRRHTAEALSR